MTGQTISHYRVLDKLGEGGMGVVYKAEDLNLHRPVALKFLRTDAVNDTHLHGRFWKEAEAAAALDHPNITTVYEIGEADSQTFIAMALVDGETLATKIKRRPLPLDEALDVASQTADALQAAHERGIVHRDIKPGNIMITPKGQVKVMDFGLAHLAGQTRITKTGAIMGTPAYMSPEQAKGEPLDRRSDIWSLGCVFYEMVTGQLPFRGDTDHALLRAILDDRPEPMTAIRVGTPPELDRIVAKALDKDPARRYQHADDLNADLGRLQTREKTAPKTLATPTRRGPRPAVLLAAALLLLAAGFAIATLVNRSGETEREVSSSLQFRQLTFKPGLQFQPAISPDGRFVAYASDEAGEGNLDIWVLQVADGQTRRLTSTPANESEPSFSPDGSRIVFRSDGHDGGISVISAQGGNPRAVTRRGQRPRFSPDGDQIAFWIGREHMPGTEDQSVYVVPTEGGEPRRLGQGRSPVWSPDGSVLLAQVSSPVNEPYWRALPIDGGAPIQTGVFEMLQDTGLRGGPGVLYSSPPLPDVWLPDGRVLFSAGTPASQDLWSVRISSETGRSLGDLARVTFGSGPLRHVSASSVGPIAIARVEENADIWILEGDTNRAEHFGSPRRLTSDTTTDHFPQLSLDGKRLVYRRWAGAKRTVQATDLETGRKRIMATIDGTSPAAVIRADGKEIITAEQSLREVSVASFDGPGRKKLCEDVESRISDVSADGTWVLSFTPPTALNTGNCQEQRLVRTGAQAGFSPDERWVTFHAYAMPDLRQVWVIPFDPTAELPEDQWIPITDGSFDSYMADWSPDGHLIYFGSERDGHRCLYAQPVDPNTQRPQGELIDVFHSHNVGMTLSPNPAAIGLSVARDKIAVSMIERTGDIWLLEPAEDAAP